MVSGSWTVKDDQTFVDNTTTTGTAHYTLAPACKTVSSTPIDCSGAASFAPAFGFASATCTDAAGGRCDCTGTIQQAGGLGVVSVDAMTSGSIATNANGFVLNAESEFTYSYCVSPDGAFTLTPQPSNPTLTGAIVFQKAGGGGSSSGSSSGSGSGSSGGSSSSSGSSSGSGSGARSGSSSGSTRDSGTGPGSSGGSSSSGGASSSSSGSGGGSTLGPCDIYKADPSGSKCVAAHSTVRALLGSYSGKLYQVRNAAGTTKDIPTLTPGGVADASVQDTFCSGTTCVVTVVYDQTGNGNDVTYEGPGSPVGGGPGMQPCNASKEAITVGGNKAYSLYYDGAGHAYWADGSKSGMPTGAQPQAVYMVTSGTHTNGVCCFDYGNGETTRKFAASGAMDAVNFSQITAWGTGAGTGPWVMADLESGLFSQASISKNSMDVSMTMPFVTAMEKNNGTTEFALMGADATAGSLTTFYKGALPAGYNPMKKQGAIVVGSGGDCCETNQNLGFGTFYEGCIVAGYPSDATEQAVQANIVAAKYSK
ncbi:MAG: hypothetical protein JOZ69_19210 [Myxococcales bacterium]|nr:hypothetical protein [Myxococcales bacterium]